VNLNTFGQDPIQLLIASLLHKELHVLLPESNVLFELAGRPVIKMHDSFYHSVFHKVVPLLPSVYYVLSPHPLLPQFLQPLLKLDGVQEEE
jgi:hypothetical protein